MEAVSHVETEGEKPWMGTTLPAGAYSSLKIETSPALSLPSEEIEAWLGNKKTGLCCNS